MLNGTSGRSSRAISRTNSVIRLSKVNPGSRSSSKSSSIGYGMLTEVSLDSSGLLVPTVLSDSLMLGVMGAVS